jgi:hypothetical protein
MSQQRRTSPGLALGHLILAAALVAGVGIGPASAAIRVPATRHAASPASARRQASTANQSLQAPLIDDVAPIADGTVQVTVTPGDTAQESISHVDVYAYALDSGGNPTGAPVATAEVSNPSPLNPPAVNVSGLTDNTEYAFEATETTASGAVSAFSSPSIGDPLTPAAPLAPTLAFVLGRDTKIKAAWDPADPDGSPVTSYTVTATPTNPADPPVTVTVDGTSDEADVTGLVNGVPYGISVTATNADGTSPAGQSDSETQGAAADGTVTPQTVYGASAPQDISAAPPPANPDGSQPDPTSLLVTWDPPFDDGGSAIDSYTVNATAAGQPPVTATVAAPATQATLTGLTPGVNYSVTVTGTQHNGNLSATSAPVTAAPDPIPAPGTIFLSAASIAAITSVTPTTVVFTSPPAQVSNLVTGNIITVEQNSNPLTADGLLRQIDQISTSGTTVTLTTSQAPLPEAFNSLDFTASGNDQTLPSSSSPMAIHVLDPAFEASLAPQLKIPLEKTFTIDLAEKLTKDPKEKERLGQNPSVSTILNIGLGVPLNFELSADLVKNPNSVWYNPATYGTFTYDFKATATPKASIGATLGIAYKSETQRQAILTIAPSCFFVYAIAMCPKLTLYAQASVNGSIKFSFSASYEKTFGGQITRDANGTTTKKDITTDGVAAFNYSITAAAKLSFAFPISFQILVYGLYGPELTITPSLEVSADTTANPWLAVSVRVQVGIFFVLDVKFATFSFGGTVLDKSFPIFSASGPFPVPYLSGSKSTGGGTPSAVVDRPLRPADATQIQYSVTWPATCDPTEGVTWSMAPGSLGTVDQTGLYTPPSPLPGADFTDVIDATTAGSAGCPSFTAQAAVHYGGTTPGASTGVAISPDGSTVSWTAPADGSTVTEYVVTVLNDPSDPAGAQTVLGTTPGTATSLAIPADRIPQIEEDGATAEVTAINGQGQGPPSDPSPPAPSTDPEAYLPATSATAGSTTIAVTAGLLNFGPSDATDATFQLGYPSVLSNPSGPFCTNNATTDILTCDPGAIPSGTGAASVITFTLGQLTPGTSYPVTLTRLSATPYPSDPDDGTATINCVADSSGNVTCS